MATDKNTLLGWFVKGAKPLASQFAAWMNSYWHKGESIPVVSIDGLQAELDKKADRELVDSIDDTKSLVVVKSGINSDVIGQPLSFPFAVKILSCTLANAASATFSVAEVDYTSDNIIGMIVSIGSIFYIKDIDLVAGAVSGSINIQFKKV